MSVNEACKVSENINRHDQIRNKAGTLRNFWVIIITHVDAQTFKL